jgi:endoglucanase
MNMENFITGYPSREFQIREELLTVLGQEKYDVFFDSVPPLYPLRLTQFLTNFFTDSDAKFLRNYGMNALRIPFNYSHFLPAQKQLFPFQINEAGFKHLDLVVKICADHGIYTIFDLHAVPGGQNTDWHSDSPGHHAAFWDLLDYQNWVVHLWKEIAKRYAGQGWVAGYNPLNEPTEKTGRKLLDFYDRVVKAIREADNEHLSIDPGDGADVVFLDANAFGSDFSFLSQDTTKRWKHWTGVVYSVHDYCKYGFPGLRYKSTVENRAYLERSFERKCTFMRENNLPIWNGEFGPVYDSKGPEVKTINSERYQMLRDQLSLYREKNIVGWSIWTYKDIGFQGTKTKAKLTRLDIS